MVDDLSSGSTRRLPGAEFVHVDLASDLAPSQLRTALAGCQAVVHLAARKRVDESVQRPGWYLHQNLVPLANLLLALEESDVRTFVFSSSAAVYGATQGEAIAETDATLPMNPYGHSKLTGERLLEAASGSLGLRAASLRYFNVAGAGLPALADTAELNLIPMALGRIRRGEPVLIFGDDYPTADGTCVRDFIHVEDLADAHLTALDALRTGPPRSEIYNVGTGRGASVAEVIDAIEARAGREVAREFRSRRVGDPAIVVADVERIGRELGWRARYGLADIIDSAVSATVPTEAPRAV